jgi:hypothetical protein
MCWAVRAKLVRCQSTLSGADPESHLQPAGGADAARHEGPDRHHRECRSGRGATGPLTMTPTTQDELKGAIAAGRSRRPVEPRAVRGVSGCDRDRADRWSGGVAASYYNRRISGRCPAAMTAIRVSPAGYGIRLDQHDINISVHGAISRDDRRHAVTLGQRGGAVRSEPKRLRVPANGAKGGWLRKIRIALVCMPGSNGRP